MSGLFDEGRRLRVTLDGTLEHFQAHARALVRDGVRPGDVEFRDPTRAGDHGAAGLFGDAAPEPTPAPEGAPALALPRTLVRRLRTTSCYSDERVWRVLFSVLSRVARGERGLVDDPLDPDVVALERMEKDVRRDAHKMHAFVRFRRVEDPDARNGERFVAWYRPTHLICERESSFFRSRFPSMDWSILTPDRSAHWDGERVAFGPGAPREAAPDGDELEDLWCDYYASIFNPARVKLKAMAAEMPRKFWGTLPETRQLDALLADVPRRLEEMARTSRRRAESAAPFVPAGADLVGLGEALASCEGCELCRDGTRAVPGRGPAAARIALLGEQPGDSEERAGRPFVGPAGEVLDAALAAAGLHRGELYVTNAVKHFRHERRGKRRIHRRPTVEHVSRCQPWLDAELRALRAGGGGPAALVCLGVTAARAVFGPTERAPAPGSAPVARTSRYAPATLTTFHPAAILRAPDTATAEPMRAHIVETLRLAGAAATRAQL